MMRWWNWLLIVAPPPLFGGLVYVMHDLSGNAFADVLWMPVTIGCLLSGHAGIAFTRVGRTSRSSLGIVYSALCPILMAYAGLLGACATGDCI